MLFRYNLCAGWHDHANMGISIIVAYDYGQNRYRIFCENNLDQFQMLIHSADILVGFNSISFDDQVMACNGVPIKTDFDILRETYAALGLEPFPDEYGPEYRGRGLDMMCQANGLGSKTGTGAMAPISWQRGNIGIVADYCMNDVRLTKSLLDLALTDSSVIDPVTRSEFTLKNPIRAYYERLEPDRIAIMTGENSHEIHA